MESNARYEIRYDTADEHGGNRLFASADTAERAKEIAVKLRSVSWVVRAWVVDKEETDGTVSR